MIYYHVDVLPDFQNLFPVTIVTLLDYLHKYEKGIVSNKISITRVDDIYNMELLCIKIKRGLFFIQNDDTIKVLKVYRRDKKDMQVYRNVARLNTRSYDFLSHSDLMKCLNSYYTDFDKIKEEYYTNEYIRDTLIKWRENTGYTQEQIAQLLATSRANVGRIENKTCRVSIALLIKYANICGVNRIDIDLEKVPIGF